LRAFRNIATEDLFVPVYDAVSGTGKTGFCVLHNFMGVKYHGI